MSAVLEPPTVKERNETSRLADLLRWAGTAAVALSGVIFLLQGLEDMDALIRNWSYLVLIAVLTACGVATRALFDDPRSARLLLGLAVALVPVQFAQLGGILHTLLGGAGAGLTELFGLQASSPAMVLAVLAATLLLTPLAAFAGFAVLVRPSARALTFAFLATSVLLLLPWRNDIAGFAVLATLGLLVPVIDARLCAARARFATGEGRAVRAMLLLPAVIATVRLGFHVEAVTGYSALAAFWAAGLTYAGRFHVQVRAVRELLYLAALVIAATAWAAWVGLGIQVDEFLAAAILTPLAGLLVGLGRLSEAGSAYRLLAATCSVTAAASLLMAEGSTGTLLAMGLGIVLLGYGCLGRERDTTLAGAAATIAAVSVLALEAWQAADVNSWVALAVAGVVLVVCASFVERFGRALVGRFQEGWCNFCQWR